MKLNYLKVKELAIKAGYEPDMFGIGHWDMPECKKFAELIVKECIDIVPWQYESKLKQHFGVE